MANGMDGIIPFAVLDKKISDLGSDIAEDITEATEAWLEENVDPDTGYVLDRTLAMQNAAAPADLVGDLKTALTQKADISVQNYFDTHTVSVNLLDASKAVPGAVMEDGTLSSIGSYTDYKTVELILPAGTYTEFAFKGETNTQLSTYRRMYYIEDMNGTKVSYTNQNSVNSTTFTLTETCKVLYSRGTFNQYQTIYRAMIIAGSSTLAYYIPYASQTTLDDDILVGNNVLYGKKWCPCGDSFTAYTDETFADGRFFGEYKTYPFLIADRNSMVLDKTFFLSGRTLAMPANPGTFTNSLTNPSAVYYYQNIPLDVDYITIYLGINDAHHAPGSSGGGGEDNTGEIPIGTINDETTATYGGAWNVVLAWLMTNRPNAHIGIIVTNGANSIAYREMAINIAKKYGLPYIDMNGDQTTPAMIRPQNTDISADVKAILLNKWAIDPTGASGVVNTHPNSSAHLFESYFIEEFLRRI